MSVPDRFKKRSDSLPRAVEAAHVRAGAAWDRANESVVQLGEDGLLDPVSAAQMQYQAANFEMLTAIHETLETIARNTRPER